MDDYLIRFAVNHDPNNGTDPQWPEYTRESNWTYIFPPWFARPIVELDKRRVDQMEFLTNLSLVYPL
jgi:carboxylesterase type B